MEKTKKFLHISVGISIIICSLSLLIFSAKANKAAAQTGTALPSGVIVVGPVMIGSGFSASYYLLGYDPKDSKITVLAKINPKDIRE